MTASILEVRDAAVTFRARGALQRRRSKVVRAVDGVSLDVPMGGTLGIVGESGSGKSTLARAIVGLEPLRGGGISVDGRPLPAAPRERGRLVQMIFQDSLNSLNPRRSIGAAIAEPIRVQGLRPRTQVGTRVAELLEAVGLDPRMAARRPLHLSGGQLQRVNIARALASEPRVLIADEPTSALDASLRGQVLNLLRKLQREQGLSYVIISHDLALIESVSDVVAVMYLGRIVETADRATMYASPEHPYTRALLAAAPRADPRRPRGAAIPGEPPSPADRPSGCAFHPRCPIATARCRTDDVALLDAGPGHRVACPVVLKVKEATP